MRAVALPYWLYYGTCQHAFPTVCFIYFLNLARRHSLILSGSLYLFVTPGGADETRQKSLLHLRRLCRRQHRSIEKLFTLKLGLGSAAAGANERRSLHVEVDGSKICIVFQIMLFIGYASIRRICI